VNKNKTLGVEMLYEKSLEMCEVLYDRLVMNGNYEQAKNILEEIERLQNLIDVQERLR
jgi:hypothetical protein